MNDSSIEKRLSALEARLYADVDLRAAVERSHDTLDQEVRLTNLLVKTMMSTQGSHGDLLKKQGLELDRQSDHRIAHMNVLHGHTEKLDDLKARVRALDGKVTAIDTKVGALDGKLQAVDGKVEALDGKLQAVDGKVEALDGKVQAVEGKVEAMGEDIAGLRGEMSSRFEAMEGKLDVIVGMLERPSGGAN